jgi:hypothetical protein
MIEMLRNTPFKTRSQSMRSVLRMLRGRKFRPARKVIRQQLDWHRRWEAQAWIALNPWRQEAGFYAWQQLAGDDAKRKAKRSGR